MREPANHDTSLILIEGQKEERRQRRKEGSEKGRRKGQDQGRGRDELTHVREAKVWSHAQTSLCSLPLGPAPSLAAAKQNSFDSYQI